MKYAEGVSVEPFAHMIDEILLQGTELKLFIDTWGLIVLRNKSQRGASYMTYYILEETFTLLFT
ncbi:MAG: hypothetical protein EF813_02990 [Methanosarcinales archaeon]|nr:MAG: hypothetical protein EF813_02990 [Methanosarcinales archaeon]